MKNFISALLATMLCLSGAFAQEQLSLADAIRLGLERNYDIKIEKRNIEIAKNNNNWGEAGRYPNIIASLNQNNTFTNIDNPAAFLTGDVQNNSINPLINLDWTIFDGFRVNITKDRLEVLEEQSQGNASVIIRNTIESIILGYYLVVLESERLNSFEEQLDLSRDRYNYQKLRVELGGAVTSDLLQEELNYLSDSINVINQELLYDNSIKRLNALLLNDLNAEYQLTDKLIPETSDFTFSDLQQKMFSENVDLKGLYITQSILNKDLSLAKSERYPTLSFNGFYNFNSNRQDLSNASLAGGGQLEEPITTALTRTIGLNFTLSFNLFDGGRINRAIQNSLISEDIGNLRIDNMKNSLSRDLALALDQYRTRKRIYSISERQREVAEKNLELSNDKFQNGSINSFDYRVVQNSNLTSQVQELQAIYNLIDSKIELMRLTGGLIQEYQN